MKPTASESRPALQARQLGILAVSVAGIGGQGTVLAGVLLGQAAVAAGLWASQTAVYTVAARGGPCSEVIVAHSPAPSPLAEELNAVLALTSLGLRHEKQRLIPGGLAIVDDSVKVEDGRSAAIRLSSCL